MVGAAPSVDGDRLATASVAQFLRCRASSRSLLKVWHGALVLARACVRARGRMLEPPRWRRTDMHSAGQRREAVGPAPVPRARASRR
jgi:hypothetical protein